MTIEERIELAREEGQSPENIRTLRKILTYLHAKAQPLNHAWRKLEQWGIEGDRWEGDYGDPTGLGGFNR